MDEPLIQSSMPGGLGAADIHGAMSVSDAMAAAAAAGGAAGGAMPGLNGSPGVRRGQARLGRGGQAEAGGGGGGRAGGGD